jgi:putative transcriptional regulator
MGPNDRDPHIDWTRFGKETPEEIELEAAREKTKYGVAGPYTHFRVHKNGRVYDLSMPEVRAIRERLGLSQAQFSERFHLSQRTVQQWEQRRAMPDMPARILLRAIELAPDVIARAAADVRREIAASEQKLN